MSSTKKMNINRNDKDVLQLMDRDPNRLAENIAKLHNHSRTDERIR